MLEHELLTETGILIVRPKGPLAASDFAALSVDADAYIEAHGALNGLMICAEEFPGWENLDGAVSHFKFVRDHHSKISKVAFVSDSDVLTRRTRKGQWEQGRFPDWRSCPSQYASIRYGPIGKPGPGVRCAPKGCHPPPWPSGCKRRSPLVLSADPHGLRLL